MAVAIIVTALITLLLAATGAWLVLGGMFSPGASRALAALYLGGALILGALALTGLVWCGVGAVLLLLSAIPSGLISLGKA